jgi:hypothetical protein
MLKQQTKHYTQVYFEVIENKIKLVDRPLKVLYTINDYRKQIVSISDSPWNADDYPSYKQYCLNNNYEYQEKWKGPNNHENA